MTAATTQLMTAAELAAMPDDGRRYELIEGVLHEMAPASFRSNKIAVRLLAALLLFVDSRGLGVVLGLEGGFRFERDPDVVLAPDAAFIRSDLVPPDDAQDRFAEVVPDLVVEVNSPTDRPGDVRAEVERYLSYGVPAIWVVDPKSRSVAIHRVGQPRRVVREPDALEGTDLLAGFRLDLDQLFR